MNHAGVNHNEIRGNGLSNAEYQQWIADTLRNAPALSSQQRAAAKLIVHTPFDADTGCDMPVTVTSPNGIDVDIAEQPDQGFLAV